MPHDKSTSDGNVTDDIDVIAEVSSCERDANSRQCVRDKWPNVWTRCLLCNLFAYMICHMAVKKTYDTLNKFSGCFIIDIPNRPQITGPQNLTQPWHIVALIIFSPRKMCPVAYVLCCIICYVNMHVSKTTFSHVIKTSSRDIYTFVCFLWYEPIIEDVKSI